MATERRRPRQSGNALIEFALIGVPLIFLLLITFELARGLWVYHTVAYAVKEGARFAVVHGSNCSAVPNNCAVTRDQVAAAITSRGVGLIPADLEVAFGAAGAFQNVAAYKGDAARFPTLAGGARFLPVEIRARYTYRSALGALLTAGGPGQYVFPASARELIQY